MIFDYSDGDFIMPLDDQLGIDSDGNLHMRMGENCSMDMDSGDLHFASPWKSRDETDYHSSMNESNSFDSDLYDDDSDDDIFGLGKFFHGLW